MAHCFMEFRGQGFWASQGQAEVWLYLLVLEIEQLASPPEWLLRLKAQWEWLVTWELTAYQGAMLDELADSQNHVQMLVELSQRAIARLRQVGPSISLRMPYSERTKGPADVCKDSDVSWFIPVGEQFIALLEGSAP